ncbi:palmitoyltransferase DHHC7, putative [Plasmodium vinckei petteri]|uniref:Palmitoyltransferase n=1 Tax=Plasmodium vinckei petteri TaxID=138298 RepID=A0A6V7TAQ2_PLAVN|nr:palmitoyltransferase DHHC7, putative [Plasmodium vinckei petteri]
MFKLKGKKKNNTLDNEILENGDSSSSGKKKKNKNKNKNKRNDEDRKYSIDKNVLNIEKNKNDNDMLDSIEVNDTGNIISDDTNENYGKTCKKQNEKNKFVHLLPVFFIFILLFGIYFIYIMYDCIPLVVRSYKKVYINYDMNWGIVKMSIFHFFLLMFLINYILSIVTPPGYIPNTEEWVFKDFGENNSNNIDDYLIEKKKTGERRFCKWCCKYKPDRAHHCRICKTCILKMDHHCPWIYNCIGYNNHKYFMLSLIYCSITTIFISLTMLNSVIEAINHNETPFNDLFLLLFGETLNSFLALIVTCFLFFHLWLTFKNMTTIEFCEKRTNYHNQSYSKFYNKGLYKNLKEVFGESPFLWLLPINNKKDDIIYFSKGNNKEYAANNIEETIPININI